MKYQYEFDVQVFCLTRASVSDAKNAVVAVTAREREKIALSVVF
jgi:hypothetical protein